MNDKPAVIVLAEDDEGHATLIRRNLQRAAVANEIVHVRDGQEALDFLRREGGHAGRPPDGPLLLLLDIHMPRVDGVEVLSRLKEGVGTRQVPVIVLTTTDDPREVQRCYQLGCSVYITKPLVYEDFCRTVRQLGLFLSIVRLPREDDQV